MVTSKDIEKDLKSYVGGGSFIKIGQLATYLGQKNTNRVRDKYTVDAFKLEGSPSYFIPDIAKNIYRSGLAVLLSLSILTSYIPVKAEEPEFVEMYATAYCCGEITANGSKVHEGGCACNPHLGEVAVVYTMDGEFIGYFECNDTGTTKGLQKGTVIDVYRSDYSRCKEFMKLTGGKVKVQWIKGEG